MNNFIITPLLGEQVGLQYAGLTDQTESRNGISNGVPLVMGFFKRGTPYKVIAVTKFTIKSILGYEPNNPHYKTIESMLAQNVGVVNVLNLGTHKKTDDTNTTGSSISCSGAQRGFYVAQNEVESQSSTLSFDVTVSVKDGKTTTEKSESITHVFKNIDWQASYLYSEQAKELQTFLDAHDISIWNSSAFGMLVSTNHSDTVIRLVRVSITQDQDLYVSDNTKNPTVTISSDKKILTACLNSDVLMSDE